MKVETKTNNSAIRNHQYELPEGWRWVRLGEVCATTENRDPRNSPDIPFRYIDISSIDNRLKRITEARTILGKDAPSRARQSIKTNDVLVATTRPNLNAVILVTEQFDNEICSTGFCVLRPTEIIDPLFLFMFIQTQYFIHMISGQVRGMLYPAVTDNQVRNVYIPLPPLFEQRRITAKLQELMQEVRRARTAGEKQLEAAKALPAAYLREVFQSEEAKKWERKRLGEVCELIMGQSPPGSTYIDKPEGLPFFQGKADFSNYFPKVRVWCTQPIKIAEQGDILISVRAPVGPVNINNSKCCIGRGLAAIRCKDKAISWFIFWYLRFNEAQIALTGSGSTFGAITRNDLINFQIPLPSIEEQKCIAAKLKEKMAEVKKLRTSIEKQLEAMNALPQAILRKAFRGEL